jgi:hypothetical protein
LIALVVITYDEVLGQLGCARRRARCHIVAVVHGIGTGPTVLDLIADPDDLAARSGQGRPRVPPGGRPGPVGASPGRASVTRARAQGRRAGGDAISHLLSMIADR